jgi:hypothetical protein
MVRSGLAFLRKVVFPCMALACLLGACNHEQPAPVAPAQQKPVQATNAVRPELPPLFDDIEKRTFQFFWDTTNAQNGLAPDRYPSPPFSSIAAIGFALTAYPIGVENGWVSREQAAERTLTTLAFLRGLPEGAEPTGKSRHHGFYYHFLDMQSGLRFKGVELSTVDTSLMMMGVLFAQSYYDGDDARERRIRALADELYRDVDWTWARGEDSLISMGWHPERGFLEQGWAGYNEAMIVYVLALGSPTHAVGPESWTEWTRTYERSWGSYQGQEYLAFGPLFGHQYSHVWIDYRGIQDAYMRERGIDYFENSRRATLAHRQYAIENPMKWKGYDASVWGLTACDGPVSTRQPYNGEQREFRGYSARGAGLADAYDDGTIAPTAAISSLPFAPEVVIPATLAMHQRHGDYLYSDYGFLDSFNPSFEYDVNLETGRIVPGKGWVARDYLGIDQGPILAMISNYRNGFVWDVMKRNPYIRRGLERAGFTGGWLEQQAPPVPKPD